MTVYLRGVTRALAERGVQTDVFTRGRPRVGEPWPGVRVIQVGKRPGLPEFTAAITGFAARNASRYDLVHSHYWQSGLCAKTLAEQWQVPLVHTYHTLGVVKNRFLAPGDLPEPDSRLYGEAEVLAAADLVVVSTEGERRQLGVATARRVYPGVDHVLFRPGDRVAARKQLGLSGVEVLIYTGRIQPLKGLELALRALAQLDRDADLYVIGGPSGRRGNAELECLRELRSALGLSGRVHFVGTRQHEALPLFYRAADAAVVCSHSESFGLASLEAQSCGTPVVGTAVGGLPAYVGAESGALVEERDPAVFAAALEEVLERGPSLREAASRSAARFSWTRTAASLAGLYEGLVGPSCPRVDMPPA